MKYCVVRDLHCDKFTAEKIGAAEVGMVNTVVRGACERHIVVQNKLAIEDMLLRSLLSTMIRTCND